MTNPGLYADLHQQMREIAALVDTVLIGLKESKDIAHSDRERLATVFDQIIEPNPEELADHLLSITLSDGYHNPHLKWRQVSQALRTNRSNSTIIHNLEQFAQLLEQKQADALAKMRGWTQ